MKIRGFRIELDEIQKSLEKNRHTESSVSEKIKINEPSIYLDI